MFLGSGGLYCDVSAGHIGVSGADGASFGHIATLESTVKYRVEPENLREKHAGQRCRESQEGSHRKWVLRKGL